MVMLNGFLRTADGTLVTVPLGGTTQVHNAFLRDTSVQLVTK